MNGKRLCLERLEGRDCPATLDLTGGALTLTGDGANDNVTQSVTGSALGVSDMGATITLTPAAFAAGWRGSGGNVVTGPRSSVTSEAFDLGGQSGDKFSLRANDVPLTVGGAAVVYVSSNAPSNTGDLLDVLATVTVNPTTSGTSLWVSDQSATSGNANVVVDNTGVHNFAGPSDNVDVLFGTGTFNLLRVTGSNSATLAESFTLAGAPCPVQLYANAGDDSCHVAADLAGVIYMQTGDDTVTVDSGVTFSGNVHTGGQTGDQVLANLPGYGTVTGTIGP